MKQITLYFAGLLIGPILVFLGVVLDSWWHFELEGTAFGPFHPLGDPPFYLGITVTIVATMRMFLAHIGFIREASSSGQHRARSIRSAVLSLYLGIAGAGLTVVGCFLDFWWHDSHSDTLEVFSPFHPYHSVVLAGFVFTVAAGARLLTSAAELSIEATEARSSISLASSRTPAAGGLQTVLFTDMASSAALRQRLGDAPAQELVHTHNSIVRDALRAHEGSEIKHTGDGIMACFHSAADALQCAIAIQRAVAAHGDQHGDSLLRVRVGLNAGEPIAEEQDLFGTAVDLAKRICDRAEPGQVLASNVVRELVAGKGFLFADQGETELRGFEDLVRVYEVRWADP